MNNHLPKARLDGIPRTALVCGACLAGLSAFSQEAITEGMEVDRGRRARKQAIDRNLYNLKAGPVLMRFDAMMGFEFNDNPNLLDDPPEVDFAFHPQVDVAALWALNPRNALSLNVGIGYIKYVNADELDHLIIAPTSELSLDIQTGDFTRFFCCLALRIVEISRNSDNGIGYFLAKIIFCRLFHFLKYHGRNFLRRV